MHKKEKEPEKGKQKKERRRKRTHKKMEINRNRKDDGKGEEKTDWTDSCQGSKEARKGKKDRTHLNINSQPSKNIQCDRQIDQESQARSGRGSGEKNPLQKGKKSLGTEYQNGTGTLQIWMVRWTGDGEKDFKKKCRRRRWRKGRGGDGDAQCFGGERNDGHNARRRLEGLVEYFY